MPEEVENFNYLFLRLKKIINLTDREVAKLQKKRKKLSEEKRKTQSITELNLQKSEVSREALKLVMEKSQYG